MKSRFGKIALMYVVVAVISLFAANAASAGVRYRIKIGSVGSDTQPTSIVIREFGEFIKERSNGEMEAQYFFNSQLGGDRQMCEAMQIGTLEIAVVSSSVLASFVPEMNILEFPYIFKTQDAAYKALDGELGDHLGDLLLRRNFRVLAWGANGYRHVTNNARPIYAPDDLRGLKIRTIENPVYVDYFKEVGANPTPMSFSELFMALQQRTVDAQENPITLIYTSKLYEAQKYISMTGHIFAVAPFVISEQYFQRLPKEYQDILLDAGRLYLERQRQLTNDSDAGFMEEMKAVGIEINELTMDQINVFAEKALPVHERYVDIVGREVLELALKTND